MQATMGTLIFVCPATGHEVLTGVEVDRATFRKLSRTSTPIFCPCCHNNHALSTIAVWLVSDEIKFARDAGTVEPKRKRSGVANSMSLAATLFAATVML